MMSASAAAKAEAFSEIIATEQAFGSSGASHYSAGVHFPDGRPLTQKNAVAPVNPWVRGQRLALAMRVAGGPSQAIDPAQFTEPMDAAASDIGILALSFSEDARFWSVGGKPCRRRARLHHPTARRACRRDPRGAGLRCVTLRETGDAAEAEFAMGEVITADAVILALGASIVEAPFRELTGSFSIRIKKVVVLDFDPTSTLYDALIFTPVNAFLLPQPAAGRWLFSNTSTDWDVRPATLACGLSPGDLQAGRAVLEQFCPELGWDLILGRVFCDANSPTGPPVVARLTPRAGAFRRGLPTGRGTVSLRSLHGRLLHWQPKISLSPEVRSVMRKFTLSRTALSPGFGVDTATLGTGIAGTAFSFGKVGPGIASEPHRHDELEAFVILSGAGKVISDLGEISVEGGDVVLFEPFEAHVLHNDGDEDLNFVDVYWCDGNAALDAAAQISAPHGPIFVFSTPPTPNGDLHLGHLSGPYFGADVYTRFLRMKGFEAYHLTGSDDYQRYVARRADADESTPEKVAHHYADEIRATLALLDSEVHSFLPTMGDDAYAEFQAACFRSLLSSTAVELCESPALFDAVTGDYLYQPDVSGLCPDCGGSAGGNVCEECGAPNLCHDLGAARSRHSAEAPVVGSVRRAELALERCYVNIDRHLRASGAPVRIMDLFARLRQRGDFSVPITHPSDWGLPAEGCPGQVIWSSSEMAFGFLYKVQALASSLGRDWKAALPSNDWQIVHFFGFDNSFNHALLYPALYAEVFPHWTPRIRYHVNEFYLLDGKKFSTSRGHAVWGKEVLSPETVDVVRLHLGLTRPEGERTDFTLDALRRTGKEIFQGIWLNWLDALHREIKQDFGGHVPDAGDWSPADRAFFARVEMYRAAMERAYSDDGFSVRRAAAQACDFVRDCVIYRQAQDYAAARRLYPARTRTSLALQATAAAILAQTLAPLMPRFASTLARGIDGVSTETWPTSVRRLAPGMTFDLGALLAFYARFANPVRDEEQPDKGNSQGSAD
ncbi:class I tRNA ligase family protein [Mesorhizobium sp. M1380]|uniref:class I tRNA ligase family protein n=1 Tax=Mesorhizobium sp. M1380 TaxID=2957093 RepID=UPI00333B52E1